MKELKQDAYWSNKTDFFFFFGVASKGLLEEETFKLRSVFKKKKKSSQGNGRV